MQCFRFEANFCLIGHPGKSTANNMRKHRSGPHRFWLFEVLQRSCFTSLHDHTVKEYYTVRARSQGINLWKCLFVYSFGMDSPFHGSLILCKVFLVVCLLFYYYFCFVGWFGALDFFLVGFVCLFWEKKDRKEEDQGVWTGAYEENGTFIEWSEYWSSCAGRWFAVQINSLLIPLQCFVSLYFMSCFKVQQSKHPLSDTTVKAEINGLSSVT